ncbi:MAG: hypothetical protein CSA29_05815 [Desulfobacterales bacterium]|nr:MAG: hypothetical protein CSA29_05815 [Desulfobacterales bacterium]
MNRREKYWIGAAGILILVVGVVQFGILPVAEKKRVLERQADYKKTALSQVKQLKQAYDALANTDGPLRAMYANREKGFTLFACLESLAVKAGVAKQIVYMRPTSSVDKVSKKEIEKVEMKLKQIKLSQLMSYLYLVETSKNVVFIKRMEILKDGKNNRGITALLHVETVKI